MALRVHSVGFTQLWRQHCVKKCCLLFREVYNKVWLVVGCVVESSSCYICCGSGCSRHVNTHSCGSHMQFVVLFLVNSAWTPNQSAFNRLLCPVVCSGDFAGLNWSTSAVGEHPSLYELLSAVRPSSSFRKARFPSAPAEIFVCDADSSPLGLTHFSRGFCSSKSFCSGPISLIHCNDL